MAPAAIDAEPRLPLRAWWSALVLMLLYALAYLDRQIIALIVAPLRDAFSVSNFQIGLLQGFAFALFFTLFALPFGAAADRYSRRWIVFWGVLAWSISTMLCGLARSFGELLAARMMVGIGEAALLPAAYSLLADLFPKRLLTIALSIFVMGALLGTELSLALGGIILHEIPAPVSFPFLGEMPPWRLVFLLTGLPGVAMAFLAISIHEPLRRSAAGERPGWAEAFAFIGSHRRFFVCHMAGFSLVMALGVARASWNPTFLVRTFHWSMTEASYALAIFGFVVGLLALTTGGRIVDFWFARGRTDAHFRYYAIAGLLLGPFGAAAYLAHSPGAFFVAMIIPTFSLSMGAIAAAAIQIVTPAPLRGKVSALYLVVLGLVGMTLGPSLVGFLSDQVFQGDKGIGPSLALVFGLFGPASALLFLAGMRSMREIVAAAKANSRDIM